MKKSRLFFLGTVLVLVGSAQSPGQGKLTPDQIEKVHSHLFHKGPVGQIPDMLSKGTGDVHIPCVVAVVQQIWGTPEQELSMFASNSDLVVLAKADSETTHTTKDFLYTDWNFVVEEVLKDNPKASVQPGTTILVTRPGGKLVINKRMVYANCADFREFYSGQEYLLYLRYVPETGAYSIDAGSRAYYVSAMGIRHLDSVNSYPEPANDKDTLLKTARDGVAASKSQGGVQ